MSKENGINAKDGRVEVAIFTQTEAALSELKSQYGDLSSVDAETKEGYAFLKVGISRLTKYRTALESERKRLKQPIIDEGRVLDGEAKRITEALVALEEPMKAMKKERDEREARAKAERIARLQAKVDAIRAAVNSARGMDSDGIANLIEEVDGVDAENDFYDLTTEACVAKRETLEILGDMLQERIQYERAEAERAEQVCINEELRAKLAVAEEAGKEYAARPEKADPSEGLVEMINEAEGAALAAAEIENISFSIHAPEQSFEIRPSSIMIDETVTIPRAGYEQLRKDSALLHALIAGGVSSWEGYDDAVALTIE